MKKHLDIEKTLRSKLAAAARLLALSAASCTNGGNSALYMGTLHPTGGTCDPPAQASLQVRNNAVDFTPNLGTLTLHGQMGPDGEIRASLTVIGAEKKPYTLKFDTPASGANPNTIEGRYITPRCTYSITLNKLS